MFNLYIDAQRREADIKDIVNTAKTLGLDTKYQIVYGALVDIANESEYPMNFETFLEQLTFKLGNPYDEEGRKAMFDLVDINGKTELDFEDLRRIADQLRFNLSDDDIREVITNVAGYGDTHKAITWEKFNKYIQKKIDKRQTILG